MTNSPKCDTIDHREKVYISPNELNLLQAIENLEYGEFVEVEIAEGEPDIIAELTIAQIRLITTIRAGTQFFTKLMVHQGQPTGAEIHSQIEGFKAIKKIRF